jgi:hypothetical protein
MKQWLAMAAAVVFLALPIMVSAEGETVIPPEVNWSPTPATPELVAVTQPRVASAIPEQAIDAALRSRLPVALTEADAQYKAVNETTME